METLSSCPPLLTLGRQAAVFQSLAEWGAQTKELPCTAGVLLSLCFIMSFSFTHMGRRVPGHGVSQETEGGFEGL